MKKYGFILLIILNYILVLIAFLFYYAGIGAYSLIFLFQLLLVYFNYKFSYKIWHIILLSCNMIISTMIGNYLTTYLYMKNISNDWGTAFIGEIIFWVGFAFVVIVSLVSIIIKTVHIKSQ